MLVSPEIFLVWLNILWFKKKKLHSNLSSWSLFSNWFCFSSLHPCAPGNMGLGFQGERSQVNRFWNIHCFPCASRNISSCTCVPTSCWGLWIFALERAFPIPHESSGGFPWGLHVHIGSCGLFLPNIAVFCFLPMKCTCLMNVLFWNIFYLPSTWVFPTDCIILCHFLFPFSLLLFSPSLPPSLPSLPPSPPLSFLTLSHHSLLFPSLILLLIVPSIETVKSFRSLKGDWELASPSLVAASCRLHCFKEQIQSSVLQHRLYCLCLCSWQRWTN